MYRPARNLLMLAAASAMPMLVGCATSIYDDESYPTFAPPVVATDLGTKAPGPTRDAPQSPVDAAFAAGSTNPAVPAADPGLSNPPAIETSGLKFVEIPAVKRAMESAVPWEKAEANLSLKIDAPDIRQNLHEGMTTLAPRVARALMDRKGEVVVVTVAVYEDARGPQPIPPNVVPSSQPALPLATPATEPATQPTYRHVAIAIAFEGFGQALDGTFVPRVLVNQPRPQQGPQEPADPNLVLDRNATSYLIYTMTGDGLSIAVLSQNELRPALADAVAALPVPAPATRPAVDPNAVPSASSTPAIDIYGLPPAYGGSAPRVYDTGETRYGVYDPYALGGPYYRGYDPYLDDLYGCRWGSGYLVGGSYFGHSGRYAGRYYDGWRDGRGHDRDWHNVPPNRPTVPTTPTAKTIPNRDLVPWQRPPIVSATNPPQPVLSTSELNANAQLRRQWDKPKQSSILSVPAAARNDSNNSIDTGTASSGLLPPINSQISRNSAADAKTGSADSRKSFIAPNGNRVTILSDDDSTGTDKSDSPRIFTGARQPAGQRVPIYDTPRQADPADRERVPADSTRASRGLSGRLNAAARDPSPRPSAPSTPSSPAQSNNSARSDNGGGRSSDNGRGSDNGRSTGGSRSDSSSSRGDSGGSRGGGARR